MMEIKIRYVVKDPVGKITMKSFMLKEGEDGLLNYWLTGFQDSDIKIISRDLFTGKQDKTGKDIYEGDIIKGIVEKNPYGRNTKTQECVFIVECITGTDGYEFYFNCRTKRKSGYNSIPGFQPWEIIGNYHQNPELLEDKNAGNIM